MWSLTSRVWCIDLISIDTSLVVAVIAPAPMMRSRQESDSGKETQASKRTIENWDGDCVRGRLYATGALQRLKWILMVVELLQKQKTCGQERGLEIRSFPLSRPAAAAPERRGKSDGKGHHCGGRRA